jgi:hypothetical protein
MTTPATYPPTVMASLERQTHIVYPAGPILVILNTTHKPIAHALILDEDDLSSHLRTEEHAFFEALILISQLVYCTLRLY